MSEQEGNQKLFYGPWQQVILEEVPEESVWKGSWMKPAVWIENYTGSFF